MLYTFIEKNSYMDSVELMVLSTQLSRRDGIEDASVMMGTPANLEIMRKGGFGSDSMSEARPNDMVIAVRADSDDIAQAAAEEIRAAIRGKSGHTESGSGTQSIHSWDAVGELGDSYQVCLISVPGEYAAHEAEEALRRGKHVMLFSDNVSEEDELHLKAEAKARGLLVMGPDCGTSILGGVPLAFANHVRRGSIGIAGAAGTGIQEVAAAIERFGGGISHAIGTGGRDLHSMTDGISMKCALAMLEKDEATKVITVVSKPPAEEVRKELEQLIAGLSKPVSVVFLGDQRWRRTGNAVYCANLTEAAREAVRLSGLSAGHREAVRAPQSPFGKEARIVGLYSGGSLASEAAILIGEALGIRHPESHEGYMLSSGRCDIIDMGDDVYTKGKPHPMMDSEMRRRKILETASSYHQPLILLLDVVLGYGAQKDPSRELAQAVAEAMEKKHAAGEQLAVVVNLLGTQQDPQDIDSQKTELEQAGAYVYFGNTAAVEAALFLAGAELPDAGKSLEEVLPMAFENEDAGENVTGDRAKIAEPSGAMMRLLDSPGVVNIGLKRFADDLREEGKQVIHFEWKPAAGGDPVLMRAIRFLRDYQFPQGPYRNMQEANEAVLEKIRAGVPLLTDIIPAAEAFPGFSEKKLLLHAGPPMTWEDMSHPMQGSCVGALLFEGWAENEDEAWRMLQNGEISFMPCHHAGFVGPMGGITSPNMPVLKVLNETGGNYAYCTMNEGIGQVLRFGAYGPTVVERLHFMKDVLGPVLSLALHTLDKGLNINVMVSRAIAMGDEFHQRNIAASLVFLKEMAPLVVKLDIPEDDKYRVIRFLADTDQFFLNVMMAAAKSVMDYAATVTEGTVVTVMTRNGKDFAVRISGMGKEWYTGPVNVPHGLYFSGFNESMANPDMGDSAITETFGVGGMAMIAAPAVTRFVGTGGFYDALEISNRMSEITLSHNGMFSIPTWDFKGTCLGIDICKVVETGITPVINTGIAHKVAGQGQIGAGTVNPPIECFTKALLAYAEKLGFET